MQLRRLLNNHRSIIAIPVTAALILAHRGAIAADTDPSGIWLRGDGNAQVEIGPCGANICATNLWIKDTSQGEAVGDRLIMTLKPKADHRLVGDAFDPKRDRSYSIYLTVKQETMTTEGCVFLGLICRTVTWSRIK